MAMHHQDNKQSSGCVCVCGGEGEPQNFGFTPRVRMLWAGLCQRVCCAFWTVMAIQQQTRRECVLNASELTDTRIKGV